MPWYKPVRPLAIKSGETNRLFGDGNAVRVDGTCNNVINGLMPGYFAWGLLTHQAMNPLCICYGTTSTGVGDAAEAQSNSHSKCLVRQPQPTGGNRDSHCEGTQLPKTWPSDICRKWKTIIIIVIIISLLINLVT